MRKQPKTYRQYPQYAYGTYRPQRNQPPKRRRTRKGAIVLVILVLIGGGVWYIARPNGAASTLANSVTKKAAVKKKEPPKPILDKALATKLTTWANAHPGDYGISVREINGTMRYAAYQGTQSFVPASTFKPFVAYTILHNIEQGKYTLQSTTYKGSTIQYCMDRMITISDNDCAYQLERKAGFAAMDTFLHEQGFTNTNLNNYDASGKMLDSDKHTTAADEAELLWRLQKGTLLNKENTDYLIGLMKKQEWRERIPAGVPDGTAVADKPGWLPGIEADMGIVYGTKSTYIITVISTGSTQSTLADLSSAVYEHLNGAAETTTNP